VRFTEKLAKVRPWRLGELATSGPALVSDGASAPPEGETGIVLAILCIAVNGRGSRPSVCQLR